MQTNVQTYGPQSGLAPRGSQAVNGGSLQDAMPHQAFVDVVSFFGNRPPMKDGTMEGISVGLFSPNQFETETTQFNFILTEMVQQAVRFSYGALLPLVLDSNPDSSGKVEVRETIYHPGTMQYLAHFALPRGFE